MANEDKIVFPNGRRLNEFALSGAGGIGDFKADGSVPAAGDWNINNYSLKGMDYIEGMISGNTSLRFFYPGGNSDPAIQLQVSKFRINFDCHIGSNSGFLRDNSGDMEIHLATGKKLKIVVG